MLWKSASASVRLGVKRRKTMKKKNNALLIATFCSIMTCMATITQADGDTPIIREEAKIVIDGVEEVWRLEWINQPSPVCGPDDEYWNTNPCNGFAFGESGDLDLIRKRPGEKDEHFALTPIFAEYGEAPAYNPRQAVLRRWNVLDTDYTKKNSPTFVSMVKARPVIRIIKFADYDHDGRSTEFILQIGTAAGLDMSVVIGISRNEPHLHFFTSVIHPNEPLILQSRHWEALSQTKTAIRVVQIGCGNHGFNGIMKYELKSENGRIHARKLVYECDEANGQQGRLIQDEEF